MMLNKAYRAYHSSHALFETLINTARLEYLRLDAGRVAIYAPRDQRGQGSWHTVVNSARALESIVLPKGIKERILNDANEFFQEERFYRELGIPYRRGYLFHGPPGTGKSSLGRIIPDGL